MDNLDYQKVYISSDGMNIVRKPDEPVTGELNLSYNNKRYHVEMSYGTARITEQETGEFIDIDLPEIIGNDALTPILTQIELAVRELDIQL